MNFDEVRASIAARLEQADDLKSLGTARNDLHKELIAPLNAKLKEPLPPEQKRQVGIELSALKQLLEELYEARAAVLNKLSEDAALAEQRADIDLPGDDFTHASEHPLNKTGRQIVAYFAKLGFTDATGPEVVSEELNFDRLNIPPNHPARAPQETLYVANAPGDPQLLRTHCTTVTADLLAKRADQTDVRIVCLGNVYRNDDDDATHSHQFSQVDMFWVGADISLANLKWILRGLCQELFGAKTAIRMRPSFFPFTEPSFEVDVSCPLCAGTGCRVCKSSGWVEILGSGMLHPNVLRRAGIDPDKRQGMAAGIGVERICMLQHQVKDIRSFYANDLRFLRGSRKVGA